MATVPTMPTIIRTVGTLHVHPRWWCEPSGPSVQLDIRDFSVITFDSAHGEHRYEQLPARGSIEAKMYFKVF